MRLWLDDRRKMPKGFDIWARNVGDAINAINHNEIDFVSFDHDLGDEKINGNGYILACIIEQWAYNGGKRIGWNIHSANPVGRIRIEQAMQSAERFWNETV